MKVKYRRNAIDSGHNASLYSLRAERSTTVAFSGIHTVAVSPHQHSHILMFAHHSHEVECTNLFSVNDGKLWAPNLVIHSRVD